MRSDIHNPAKRVHHRQGSIQVGNARVTAKAPSAVQQGSKSDEVAGKSHYSGEHEDTVDSQPRALDTPAKHVPVEAQDQAPATGSPVRGGQKESSVPIVSQTSTSSLPMKTQNAPSDLEIVVDKSYNGVEAPRSGPIPPPASFQGFSAPDNLRVDPPNPDLHRQGGPPTSERGFDATISPFMPSSMNPFGGPVLPPVYGGNNAMNQAHNFPGPPRKGSFNRALDTRVNALAAPLVRGQGQPFSEFAQSPQRHRLAGQTGQNEAIYRPWRRIERPGRPDSSCPNYNSTDQDQYIDCECPSCEGRSRSIFVKILKDSFIIKKGDSHYFEDVKNRLRHGLADRFGAVEVVYGAGSMTPQSLFVK